MRRSTDDHRVQGVLRALRHAHDVAIEFLAAHRDKHGCPLRRWVYAVTSNAIPPPKLMSKKELNLDANGILNLGVLPAQDSDVSVNDHLVAEYVVWKGHKWGESTRPEDNPWDLSGYVAHDLYPRSKPLFFDERWPYILVFIAISFLDRR